MSGATAPQPGAAGVDPAAARLVRAFPRLVVASALRRAGFEASAVSWTFAVRRSSAGVGVLVNVRAPDTVPSIAAGADRIASAASLPVWVEEVPQKPHRLWLWASSPKPSGLSWTGPIDNHGRAIPLGLDHLDQVRGPRLWDEAGGRSLLIAGQPGAGKTHALRVMLESLRGLPIAVCVIDPKGGSDFADSVPRNNLVDGYDAAQVLPVLRVLDSETRARRTVDGQGVPRSLPWAPLLVVVDEWQNLAANGDRKEQTEAAAILRRLLSMGRSANLAVVLATQRPMSDVVDTGTRGLIADRIAFAVGQDPHAAAAVGLPQAADLHPAANRGEAWAVLDGGTPFRLRVFPLPTPGGGVS